MTRLRLCLSPPGTALHLGLGCAPGLSIQVRMPAPRGGINIHVPPPVAARGLVAAPAPRGAIHVHVPPPVGVRVSAATIVPCSSGRVHEISEFVHSQARTRAPCGAVAVHYDINLSLSTRIASHTTQWRQAQSFSAQRRVHFRDASLLERSGVCAWSSHASLSSRLDSTWRGGAILLLERRQAWREGITTSQALATTWMQGARLAIDLVAPWRDGVQTNAPLFVEWQDGWRAILRALECFTGGSRRSFGAANGWCDGLLTPCRFPISWRQAGYPAHWIRVRPPRPPVYPPQPPVRLCIHAVPEGALLHIGGRCLALEKRWYSVFNTASLVRLPDRVPLPATNMTIKADFQSWCWSLSATLSGANAFALVAPQAPNFLPIEVEASINGYVWQFLLDTPNHERKLASSSVSLSGRSRSAWLGAPYRAKTSGVNAQSITMAQAAELAVENTGWSIVWDLPDWTIPAGLLRWSGTPIERLLTLVRAVDAVLFTDQVDDILYARPKYPAPPWRWNTLTTQHVIPESLATNIKQTNDWRAPLNGVFVSGTTAGVLASCKIAGTDGALQASLVTDALLCDTQGAAARARAEAILSAAGPGSKLSASILLMPISQIDPPHLVLPCDVVELAGVKGIARSVQLSATPKDGGLVVNQSIEIERREVA